MARSALQSCVVGEADAWQWECCARGEGGVAAAGLVVSASEVKRLCGLVPRPLQGCLGYELPLPSIGRCLFS